MAASRIRLERPADGEFEHRPFFHVGVRLSIRRHGIDERGLVWEGGAGGHDGRLQVLAYDRRVVSPVEAEGRVDYRQHHLKFQTGGCADPLRTRSDEHLAVETGLRELIIEIGNAARIHRKLAGAQDPVHTGIPEDRQDDGPDDGNTVLEVGDYLGVAAGGDELIPGDRHGDRHAGHDAVLDHLLRARAAIVVQHVDAGAGGDIGDGRDAPNLEAADILLAADKGAREWRDELAAVAGDQGTQRVKSQDVTAMPGRRMEVLHVDRRPDGIDVAAQDAAREIDRDEHAASGGGGDRMIDGVVGVRGNDVTGFDSGERIRPGDAAEVDVREVGLRRIRGGNDVGNVEPVGDAHPGETALDGIAGRNRNAVAVLRVVEQVLLTQLVVEGDQVTARQNRSLAALIVVETPQVDDEDELQRAVQEVGFGEPQADIAHAGAE